MEKRWFKDRLRQLGKTQRGLAKHMGLDPSRITEILNESRSIKDVSKMVGKAEKSRGRWIKRVIVNIKIARENDAARPMSNTIAGIGRIIMTIIAIKANAKRIVGLKRLFGVSDGMLVSLIAGRRFSARGEPSKRRRRATRARPTGLPSSGSGLP